MSAREKEHLELEPSTETCAVLGEIKEATADFDEAVPKSTTAAKSNKLA